MKRITSIFAMVFAVAFMFTAIGTIDVFADETTDLSEMHVYAVTDAGERSEVPFTFDSQTYEYNITIMSNATSIEIEASTVNENSKWVIERASVNTKMDPGDNVTRVNVTSEAGASQQYVINTHRLTPEEEETYEAPTQAQEQNNDNADVGNITVGDKTLTVAPFTDDDIPNGFKKDKITISGTEYDCIKGEVKKLTAVYLKDSEDKADFYIFDEAKGSYYPMNNIQVKSRMYTIVEPEKTDECLSNYDKKDVTIIDREVSAWALNEAQGLYLVYAMNWNGDTNLYCYDDSEKCFLRYLPENDINTQMKSANESYNKMKDKYNDMVTKFNRLLKIICLLAAIIIALLFVILNLALNRKEKRLKREIKERREASARDDSPADSSYGKINTQTRSSKSNTKEPDIAYNLSGDKKSRVEETIKSAEKEAADSIAKFNEDAPVPNLDDIADEEDIKEAANDVAEAVEEPKEVPVIDERPVAPKGKEMPFINISDQVKGDIDALDNAVEEKKDTSSQVDLDLIAEDDDENGMIEVRESSDSDVQDIIDKIDAFVYDKDKTDDRFVPDEEPEVIPERKAPSSEEMLDLFSDELEKEPTKVSQDMIDAMSPEDGGSKKPAFDDDDDDDFEFIEIE